MSLPFNSKHRNSLMPAILLVFFCIVAFPLSGQTQEELDRELYNAIYKLSSIERGDISQVRSLLEKGANPNGLYNKDDHRTILMETLRTSFSDNFLILFDMLLEYGADLFAKDKFGRNAAYYFWDPKAMDYLVSKGVRFDITDNEGISPLLYNIKDSIDLRNLLLDWEEKNSPNFKAGFKSRKDYLNALLSRFSERGQSVHMDWEFPAMDLMFRLLESGADPALLIKSESDRGKNLIEWVISWGKVDYIEKLFKFGVKPDSKNPNGIPYVMYAPIKYPPIKNDKSAAVIMLIEKGAPVNGVNKEGDTLLIRATDAGNIALVRFLLQHGANPNIQNNRGETALMKGNHYGAEAEEIINALMAGGADPNLQDRNGKTALMHLDYIFPKFSLRDGVDPTIKDLAGRDALFYCQKLDASMVDYMISKGCQINAQDKYGYTPLSLAARYCREGSIVALLSRGADPNIQDNKGRSALHTYLLNLKLEEKKYQWPKETPWGKDSPQIAIPAFLSAGALPALKDNEGKSALIYVVYISNDFPAMKPFCDQMLKYANADEIKEANNYTKMTLAENRKNKILYSDYFEPAIGFLTFSLLWGGLSIAMRERVYDGRESENWFGTVNSILTMGSIGTVLGSFILARMGGNDPWSRLAGFYIGALFGGIGGSIIGALPPVQRAFRGNPALYYSLPSITAVTGIIFSIKVLM